MQEKRQYVRMKTVFPVEFRWLEPNASQPTSWIQGFTNNVSAGGLCIEFKIFDEASQLKSHEATKDLEIVIHPPFTKKPIVARAKLVWTKQFPDPEDPHYQIGVQYTDIQDAARSRLIGYAKRLWLGPRLMALSALAVFALTVGLFIHNQKLLAENRALVVSSIEAARKKTDTMQRLYRLEQRKDYLDRSLKEADQKISDLEKRLTSAEDLTAEQKKQYEAKLKESAEYQNRIQKDLKRLSNDRGRLEIVYQDLQNASQNTRSTLLRQMVSWLRSHQNKRTGLVASFEGDAQEEDAGYTYDQSLACQTFLIFGDVQGAQAILDFYADHAATEGGAFFNGYDTQSGEVRERVLHVGPNVWIGIAALWHDKRLGSTRYQALARRIGDWLLSLMDAEGGLRGGPAETWYSTEHHLDAVAYFRMLYAVTHDSKYKDGADRALSWIKKYAYSTKDRRLNRGKGDATIATDTFSWAIAALGPETLMQNDFDPIGIIEFAEKHCGVKVDFRHPSGASYRVEGFDFAKAAHVGRGGIISVEWTAQMIVSYEVLERYYEALKDHEKATLFRCKADFYLNEISKLIIVSPSPIGRGRGCLPYASADNADTGHGWRTPRGERTGSVAATAYGIFAWLGYNPFDLDNSVTSSLSGGTGDK